ncbi:MAG: hypothetical protein ACJASR_001349 [Psychroserpens sp.]
MPKFKNYSEYCTYYKYDEKDDKVKLAWENRIKNASRQRKHREKVKQSQTCINMSLDFDSYLQLKQLSKHYLVTQKELIENYLRIDNEKVLNSLNENQAEIYFGLNE